MGKERKRERESQEILPRKMTDRERERKRKCIGERERERVKRFCQGI